MSDANRSQSDRTEWQRESGTTEPEQPPGQLSRLARRGVTSGAVAAVAGGVLTLRGLRLLRARKWGRAIVTLFSGGLLLALARAQRTQPPSEQPTLSSFADEPADPSAGTGETTPETGKSEPTVPAGEASTPFEDESYERLGQAAFDEHANEVPAPQQAFDRQLLTLGSEVAWGVREADGLVVVSEDYDAIADRTGMHYVASSEVEADRTVAIPDTVTTHWDQLVESGSGILGGEDVVFGTSPTLADDHLLVVVPEAVVDEVEWEE